MAPEPFPELKDTARTALVRAARLLARGFTGRIIIDAREGGVGNFESTEKLDGKALMDREDKEAA